MPEEKFGLYLVSSEGSLMLNEFTNGSEYLCEKLTVGRNEQAGHGVGAVRSAGADVILILLIGSLAGVFRPKDLHGYLAKWPGMLSAVQ